MNNTINKIKEKIEEALDKIKSLLYPHLIAKNGDPVIVRKKRLRLMTLLGVGMVGIVIVVYYAVFNEKTKDKSIKNAANSEAPYFSVLTPPSQLPTKIEINKLAQGVTNEQVWMVGAEKKLEELKAKQKESDEGQDKLKEHVDMSKVSKQELVEVLQKFEQETKVKYDAALQEVIRKFQSEPLADDKTIEVASQKFKKIKRIGDYIPAGTYVTAKMISGVDVGVGVLAASDPRQVLLRITGKAISAGYGKDYLSTDRLIGCLVQAKVKGDLSSEKAYPELVLMTCAINKNTVIELPVKGSAYAMGKVGIRGEIVSREGDLVMQSFLAGLIGGFGNGIAEYSRPQMMGPGGTGGADKQSIQDMLKGGLGAGVSNSSRKAEDYLIKRAEQYQPVISINEGVDLHLVFQEGFSLTEEEQHAK